jgi:hypothetical protein
MYKVEKIEDIPGPGAYNGNVKAVREKSPGYR